MKVEVKCLCKDCKYCEDSGYPWLDKTYYCYYWDHEEGMSPNKVDPNGFCSKADMRK